MSFTRLLVNMSGELRPTRLESDVVWTLRPDRRGGVGKQHQNKVKEGQSHWVDWSSKGI